MSHPDQDVLADLALGELVATDLRGHVAKCPSCTADLDSLRATLGVLRSPSPALVLVPAGVWDRVLTAVDDVALASLPPSASPPSAGAEPGENSPSSPRSDELADRRARRGRRKVGLAWVAGAAAAGLVFGAVGTRVLKDDAPPIQTIVASTTLDTLDTSTQLGSASLVDRAGNVDLDVRTESLNPDGGYLEVWLINRDLKRMVSIGVLRPGQGDQSFTVAPELIEQGYVIVDISREGFDDKPQHSGDSLVRGTLPA